MKLLLNLNNFACVPNTLVSSGITPVTKLPKVTSRFRRLVGLISLQNCFLCTVRIQGQTSGSMRSTRKWPSKVKVTWKVHEGHTPEQVRQGKVPDLVGYQEISCHMVFDIKMDFTHKARFVTGGHTTEAPALVTYLSVMSHDSVHLAFLIAALNDVNILSCDLENAYLNAKCCKKIWFEGGVECGKDAGKVLVIVQALYG